VGKAIGPNDIQEIARGPITEPFKPPTTEPTGEREVRPKIDDVLSADTTSIIKDEEVDYLEEFEVVKMVKCPRCDKLLPIPSEERPLAIECFRCGARGKLTM